MEERRKFVRLEAPVQVKYKISVIPPIEDESKTKNISAGGVKIILGEKLIPGVSVELEISIPGIDRVIYASGEIVWQDEAIIGTEVCHETGIKFTKISPEDEEVISKYIYKELNERVKNPEED